jgi:hypothetical protein
MVRQSVMVARVFGRGKLLILWQIGNRDSEIERERERHTDTKTDRLRDKRGQGKI